MADQVLEAFIKLFADDTRLRQQMGALKAEAEKAGADVSQAFEQGTARGGGPAGPKGPSFPRFGTTFAGKFGSLGGLGGGITGRGLGGPGGGTEGGGFAEGLTGRGGAAGGLAGALRRGGPLREAAQVAGLGEFTNVARLAAGHPLIAGAAVGAAALGKYVLQVKEAAAAEQELRRVREGGDTGAANALLEKRSNALKDLQDSADAANTSVTGLESLIRRMVGGAQVSLAEVFGKGMEQRIKEVKAAEEAADQMWRSFGAPKFVIDGLKRSADALKEQGEAAVKAAEDTISYSAAVDKLTQAINKKAEADNLALDVERMTAFARRGRKEIGAAELAGTLADIEKRRGEIEPRRQREQAQTQETHRRQLGEMEALEVEHTQKMVSLAQQRHDAIVQTLGQIVEIESATTLSLEETYRARFALQAESTQNTIRALETETAARRKALEARLGGATGQERVKLERDLTTLTEEHETKRTEIEGRNIAERLRLYRQAQQEKLALQERVFAIERTLGERSLHDDLARQTAIAAGAQAGSQTQLRALEQVAQSVKALSDQAKAFLSEALSAADELARKTGAPAAEFVSREGLAASAAERFTQLEEAQRTFEAGGQIRREDFQSLASGGLERLKQQREAGIKSLAASFAQSGAGVPPGLSGAALNQMAFGEQITGAFEKPIDKFTSQVGPQFASMVDKAAPQFQEMTDIWSKAVDAMVAKAEDGSSKMGAALYENFKTRLTRDLEREVRTF